MKIAVISDTHIGDRRREAPPGLWDLVKEASAVVHLGDFTDEAFARKLRRSCRLYAISGDADPLPVRSMFPPVRVVEFAGVRAVLMHQFPGPWSLAVSRVDNYRRLGISLILFGHTHKPENLSISGVRLLNPGSAGDGRRMRGVLTAGMLELDGSRFNWELCPLGREVLV
jgi:hypothetical protein